MAPELPASLAFFITHSLYYPLDGPYKLTQFLSPPSPRHQQPTPSLLPHWLHQGLPGSSTQALSTGS